MNRRQIVTSLGASALLAGAPGRASPLGGAISVGFLLGDFANVIDLAGPWEVFQDTMGASMERPQFSLSTIAPSASPVTLTGGLRVIPDHVIGSAPIPDVLVVPAQRTNPVALAWLKRSSPSTRITLSICTGAFQLGRAGLLDGLHATTHHDSWDSFEREFRSTTLVRGRRFVDAGRIVTAGGLTSGIDAALHVVARLCGEDAAAATAAFMEYRRSEAVFGG